MGAGGRMSAPSPNGKKTAAEALRRAPHEKPPFTIGDLKKAIPPHCFQKSLITSFRYLIQDLLMAYSLYYVATNYIDLLPRPLNYLGWAVYIAVQGCVLTGAWVVGHECDHHAFSEYQWVDDLVGLVVHSSLMVPYFSWKISHRRHHANTQSLDNDEVYVPRFKSNIRNYYKILNNPPGRVFVWVTTLLIGFPLYLMFNVSGHKYERWTSHYDPHSPLYSDRERKEIIISDVAILAVIYGLYRLVLAKGFAWVFLVYGGPLLVVNGWFVLITILNHTHPSLPYYDSTEWDWLRGALCTVDRDYGILNKVFHNVCNAHVCHHIFSMIPHYHGLEATEAMKPILGEYYQYDGTPILKACAPGDTYAWAVQVEEDNVRVIFRNPGMEDDPTCGPIIDDIAIKKLFVPETPKDNAVLNGDFEEGPWMFRNASLGVLLPTNLDEETSSLPGWIVESNRAVRYIDSNHFTVPEGKRAVELLSGKEGIISQMVQTKPNKPYRLSFSFGHAGDKCKQPLAVMAFAGDQAQNIHYTPNSNATFMTADVNFTAKAERTRVAFYSVYYNTRSDDMTSLCGPVVDDVRVAISGSSRVGVGGLVLVLGLGLWFYCLNLSG